MTHYLILILIVICPAICLATDLKWPVTPPPINTSNQTSTKANPDKASSDPSQTGGDANAMNKKIEIPFSPKDQQRRSKSSAVTPSGSGGSGDY